MKPDLVAAALAEADAVRGLERARTDAIEKRDKAIRTALAGGATVAELVRVTRLSRSQVERVRDARPRTGNRKRPQIAADARTATPEGGDTGQGLNGEDGDYTREAFNGDA